MSAYRKPWPSVAAVLVEGNVIAAYSVAMGSGQRSDCEVADSCASTAASSDRSYLGCWRAGCGFAVYWDVAINRAEAEVDQLLHDPYSRSSSEDEYLDEPERTIQSQTATSYRRFKFSM